MKLRSEISQSAEDPALQGGVDMTWGLFYAGVWASSIDFSGNGGQPNAEVDFYAGITPKLGSVDFDFGVIYYVYPSAPDAGAELDYVELKAAASMSPVDKLSLGATVYYSPEYTGAGGETWTVEGSASYELPKVAMFTPTISALVGSTINSDNDAQFVAAFSDDQYMYWNAGITLAVGKLEFDFRYWDTDISAPNFCTGAAFQCDERFVFSAKFTY